MTTLSIIRHQEIFNPEQNDHGITIIGAGAVGSRIYATLIELGLKNIDVYDPDIVEEHNLSNQLYGKNDVGVPKVDGLYKWTLHKLGFVPSSIKFYNEFFTSDTPTNSTVFLLVDSLQARRDLSIALSKKNNVVRVIDVRMAAAHGNVYVFSPIVDIEKYLITLGNDEDAEVSACGSPFSVAPTAAILSNMAVWSFIHAKTNLEALDQITNVYFKPYALYTNKL